MAVKLSHRAEFALVRGVEAAVATLPAGAADRLGAGLGALIHRPAAIRRATVLANLRRAFPDATDHWIQSTARDAYRHLGREAVAMMRLSRMGSDEVVVRTDMVGWEPVRAAADAGRGLVFTTGHFGNWEVAAAAVSVRGIPFSAIVQRQSNPLVNAAIEAGRHVHGIETIERGEAPRRVPRALRAGRAVGVVMDQDAARSGVWVPFFGHPASTPRGAALFVLRFGVPVFTIAATRIPGEPRYRVAFEEVVPRRTGDLEADIVALTAELTARLEAAIRQAPEQYFWFHRRWKTVPPTELGSASTGTTRVDDNASRPEDHQL